MTPTLSPTVTDGLLGLINTPPLATQSGVGLITGVTMRAQLFAVPPGTGIVFFTADGVVFPARTETVVNTERGVTLIGLKDGQPTRTTLSIVEHFLSACAMAGVQDLAVAVMPETPDATMLELPLLDGGAQAWLTLLSALPVATPPVFNAPHWTLTQPIAIQLPNAEHGAPITVTAQPDTHFRLTYLVNFDHPELTQRWAHWDITTMPLAWVADAQTFGHVRELPQLQAMGLAKGVSFENTLGLTDDGSYTRPLRRPLEPIYHKMLDFLGDAMLSGVNPLHVGMHVIAMNAGHTSHVAFAKALPGALTQPPTR